MKATPIVSNANNPGVGVISGWNIYATAAAEVRLRAGIDTGDILVERIVVPINEAVTFTLPRGIPAVGDVYVEVVSGTIVGTLFHD